MTADSKDVKGTSTAFSVSNMDPSVDPWKDFFSYSSGSWARNNPIPESKASWGSFEELVENNDKKLREILEECAQNMSGNNNGIQEMLGRFYKSAMDTETLERLKFDPVIPYIESVEKISSVEELAESVANLHKNGISVFFHSWSHPDEKNTSIYALYLSQGGLTLPNRDYYLEDSFSEIRDHYRKHIVKMFTMYGVDSNTAASYSEIIMSIETELAKASRTQTELRDAEKNYNRKEMNELHSSLGVLNFAHYMEALKIPSITYGVIGQPEFFDSLRKIIDGRNLDDLKVYLKWHVLTDAAPFLHSDSENEHFDMFNRKLRGQAEPEPRWKRSAHIVDGTIGEALGKLYVEKHFGNEARERMALMVEDIKSVFLERLKSLPWMTEETKKRALAKFDRFRTKIGHPETFRDYSSIEIKENDFIGNVERASIFEINREMKRIGEKVDRNEWLMTPPTVNAYFSPPDNEIVFPAGILQPPFFDVEADVAVNYGAIGGVISHEITHGYDDQGRRYDEDGNLNDWWKEEDASNFQERADSVIEQYSKVEVLPGVHVNGELTLGENIADFGGVSIAYEALQRRLKREPELRKNIDGFTPEQRFFLSWAQVWRNNIRNEYLKMLITLDPHSPNSCRATIPVYNHPDFEKAFPSSEGREQVLEKKVSIW